MPVGDCRKIVWMRDKDEMEWWGVRAYNHAEGYWQSNSREESSTVLFWMETPHSPHYPPASHAAESAAPDTLHFCAACWAGNHGSCSGDKCGCAHDSASVSTAQLDAEDQHSRRAGGGCASRLRDCA